MNPSMRRVRVPLDDESFLSLDLRKIDHQPIFLDGSVSFEAEERRMLRCLTPRGGTAIDVGANQGVYALTLARLVGESGLVIAYEPDASDLLINAARWPQVIVRPFVVANAEGRAAFRRERSSALSHIVPGPEKRAGDADLQCVTLDSEIGRLGLKRVDFIKIDVEGAEDRVLTGAASLLRSRYPPVVFFEWIPAFRSRWNKGALAVLKEIGRSSWRLFRVGWGKPTAEIIGFAEPEENCNIIAFPDSRDGALIQFLAHTMPAPEARR